MSNSAPYGIRMLNGLPGLGSVGQGKRTVTRSTKYDQFWQNAEVTKDDPMLMERGDSLTGMGSITDVTVSIMHEIVRKYGRQAKAIAQQLRYEAGSSSREDILKAIWTYFFENYQYKIDNTRFEELRTPARAYSDRYTGIDCDCFAISIAAILDQLGIPWQFRRAKYEAGSDWSHIYVVVPTGSRVGSSRSSYIVVDPVVHKFNYEWPNNNTPTHYVDGVGSNNTSSSLDSFLDGLNPMSSGMGCACQSTPYLGNTGLGRTIAGKANHILQKINPLTIAARAGMRLWFSTIGLKQASNMIFGYYNEFWAKEKGFDLTTWRDYVDKKNKAEDVYWAIGGNEDELLDAVYKGAEKKLKGHPNFIRLAEIRAGKRLIDAPNIQAGVVTTPRTTVEDFYKEVLDPKITTVIATDPRSAGEPTRTDYDLAELASQAMAAIRMGDFTASEVITYQNILKSRGIADPYNIWSANSYNKPAPLPQPTTTTTTTRTGTQYINGMGLVAEPTTTAAAVAATPFIVKIAQILASLAGLAKLFAKPFDPSAREVDSIANGSAQGGGQIVLQQPTGKSRIETLFEDIASGEILTAGGGIVPIGLLVAIGLPVAASAMSSPSKPTPKKQTKKAA